MLSKEEARYKARALRASLSEANLSEASLSEARRHQAAQQVCRRFFENVTQGVIRGVTLDESTRLAAYYPSRDELDVLPLLGALGARGVVTLLPGVPRPGLPLQFYAWRVGDALTEGRYGIPVPARACDSAHDSADSPLTPTHVCVPLLAWDQRGFRLGYGGGYYDRTLVELRQRNRALFAFGVAYEEQYMADLPTESHDQKLDALLTPERFVRFASSNRAF